MDEVSRRTTVSHTPAREGDLRALLRHRKGARTACTLAVRLETSATASDRLLALVDEGTENFILVSGDGRISARVRLKIDAVQTTEHQFVDGAVVVDWARATVRNGENCVLLPRTELRLLAALLEGGGTPISRTALIGRVWPGSRMRTDARENALAVYVCSLRKRMAAIGLGTALQTVRGVGYRVVF